MPDIDIMSNLHTYDIIVTGVKFRPVKPMYFLPSKKCPFVGKLYL